MTFEQIDFNYFDNSHSSPRADSGNISVNSDELGLSHVQDIEFIQQRIRHFQAEETLEKKMREGVDTRISQLGQLLNKKDEEIWDLNLWLKRKRLSRIHQLPSETSLSESDIMDQVRELSKILRVDKSNYEATGAMANVFIKLKRIREVFGDLMQVIYRVFLHDRPLDGLLTVLFAMVVRF